MPKLLVGLIDQLDEWMKDSKICNVFIFFYSLFPCTTSFPNGSADFYDPVGSFRVSFLQNPIERSETFFKTIFSAESVNFPHNPHA